MGTHIIGETDRHRLQAFTSDALCPSLPLSINLETSETIETFPVPCQLLCTKESCQPAKDTPSTDCRLAFVQLALKDAHRQLTSMQFFQDRNFQFVDVVRFWIRHSSGIDWLWSGHPCAGGWRKGSRAKLAEVSHESFRGRTSLGCVWQGSVDKSHPASVSPAKDLRSFTAWGTSWHWSGHFSLQGQEGIKLEAADKTYQDDSRCIDCIMCCIHTMQYVRLTFSSRIMPVWRLNSICMWTSLYVVLCCSYCATCKISRFSKHLYLFQTVCCFLDDLDY